MDQEMMEKFGGAVGGPGEGDADQSHRDGAAPEHQPHPPALARQQVAAADVRRETHLALVSSLAASMAK